MAGSSPKTRLCILFGGRSGEHDVSLKSAASVVGALDSRQFELTVVGLTREGKLASKDELRKMLPVELHGRVSLADALEGGESRLQLAADTGSKRRRSGPAPQVVFPLLHGPYGEDGTIQGLLEMAGIPYVGCGVLASAAGMDKDVMKRLFRQAGLPVLPYRTLRARDLEGDLKLLRRQLENDFGYPLFSKPANLGSSIGVRKIHSEREFAEAVRFSAQFDRKIIVEKGIDARELECGVLGNDDPEASVVGEVFPGREFYDYAAKYEDPASRLQIPAALTPDKAAEVRLIAIAAFRSIEGSGLARVDFFLERRTGRVWLNEINTMPGFTPISMYPKLWAACGVSFNDLVTRLARLAVERHRERNAVSVTAKC